MGLLKYFKSLFSSSEKVLQEYDDSFRRLLKFDNTRTVRKSESLECSEESPGPPSINGELK